MNILGTATVIRGKGACDVLVNGIKDQEIERINELHAKEMEVVMNELRKTKDCVRMMPMTLCKKKNLARKMIDLRLNGARRISLWHQIREGVVFIWACIWVFGIKRGIWGYWDDEANDEFRRELRKKERR